MLRAGTTTFEAKSGYGLDRETELTQLRAISDAGGIPTWLGAHTVPPEFADDGGDAYVDFLLADVLPEAAQIAEAADVFLERGAFDVEQARRYLTACRDAGLALRLHGDQFTESGAIGLAIELGARSVDHLEATGDEGVAALARSDVTGVLLPASALFLGRPMPPARALVDAGAAVALATDFNPGSAFCESLPLVCSLAAMQLSLAPEEALCGMHGERGTRPRACGSEGPAGGGIRRRRRPHRGRRLAASRLSPGWRRGAHGDRRRGDRLESPGIIDPMATKKQRRRRAKEHRHDYVWVDDEGNEVDPEGSSTEKRAERTRSSRRDPQAPSWQRTLKRGAIFAPIMFGTVLLLSPDQPMATKITQTLLIVAIFIPFSYFLDRFFYRTAQRRAARQQSDGRRGS